MSGPAQTSVAADTGRADTGRADPGGSDTGASDPEDELDHLGLDDPHALATAIEAVLFVSDTPLSTTELATGLRRPMPEVAAALEALGRRLDERGAGVEVRAVAGGHRLYTRAEVAPAVEQFLRDGQRTRLTQAALETLAVIAYRQPVTRGRIAAIRGVSVDGVVRTLASRGLVSEVGADPDTGAGLYATTELFLEKIGVSGLDELPSLAPLLPGLDELDADDGLDFDGF